MSDYLRIEKAIAYLVEHVAEQPNLDAVAAHVHLSPFHFQRLFCRWAGTTPKRFLQVLTLERGKHLLAASRPLLETAHSIGLSGSSRLHDHFVQLEAVTPGEYKSRGRDLQIRYGVHATPFGELFLAATQRGVCCAGFVGFLSIEEQLSDLQKKWPLALFVEDASVTSPVIDILFGDSQRNIKEPLCLHVAGTNFQIAVWRALLKIPEGALTSYSELAAELDRPSASRAVGNAVGANPVAFLIPCHRVIQRSGALGGYRWGPVKKHMIYAWERARAEGE